MLKKTLRKMLLLITRLVFSIKYNVKSINKPDSFTADKSGVLFLSNNTSWIDAAIILIASDDNIRFVFPRYLENNKIFNFLMNLYDVIKIDDTPEQLKDNDINKVAQALNKGQKVCMFPEKAITFSGQMGYFYDDFEKVLEKTDDSVVIYPIYLKGLFGSIYSRASNTIKKNKNMLTNRRKVFVMFGAPRNKENSNKALIKEELSRLSVVAWKDFLNGFKTIPEEFIRTAKRNPGKECVVDSTGVRMNYRKALTTVLALRERVLESKGENVGILLPTTAIGALFNMAVLAASKNVVNLNYTSPVSAIKSSLEKADVKDLYTSKQFIDKLEKRGVYINELFENVNIIYLEDEKKKIKTKTKLKALLSVLFLPKNILQKLYCEEKDIDETAAILFSSGSEGEPKGVVLSHKNILTNTRQISDSINIHDDAIMASLPLFHAFGLTVTTIWPMLEGVKMVCHPDPKDIEEIGKLVYKENVTIMCSTNSFLNLFVEKDIEPLMLAPIRHIIAGAEKVKESTRNNFKIKFNKEIYEGYGATETGPVASANIPDTLNTVSWKPHMTQKKGTVGMALPGGAFKIVDPESFEELNVGDEGMILIAGNQVMKGYLKDVEKTNKSIINDELGIRWYITGDKGKIDEDGFLTVLDRYSRFAKIKGEMISLTALEQDLMSFINDSTTSLIAVNIPDEKNGEKIVLLFESTLSEEEVKGRVENSTLSYISRPKHYIKVDEIPVLGTGKLDFKEATKIAYQKLG